MEPYNFDINSLLLLNFDGGSFLDWLMFTLTGKLIWIPLYLGVLVWIGKIHGWKYALLFLVTAALLITCADQTATFFKNYVPKLRPSHNDEIADMLHTVGGYRGGLYGTVSSHAANSIAFALLSSFAIQRRWYFYSIIVWALIISYTRIYLGVHYPMDIFFGLLNGTIWAVIWWWILCKVEPKLIK